MTTLIKTRNTITGKSVGNIHGYYGPSDYTAMLDFNIGEYYTMVGGQRNDYNLEDAVIVARNRAAEYLDIDGIYKSVVANEPRLHFMPEFGYRGLLGEAARTNIVAAPSSPPPTQDVTIPAGNAAARLVLSSYGSGAAELVSPNLTLEASEGKVKIYTRSTASEFVAQLVVTGSVSKVQAEFADPTGPYASSFILGDAPRTRPADTAQLASPFAALVGGEEATIVANYIKLPMPPVPIPNSGGSLYVQKSGEELGGLYLSSTINRGTGANGTEAIHWAAPSSAINTSVVVSGSLAGPWVRRSVRTLSYGASGDEVAFTGFRNASRNDDTGRTISPPDIVGILGNSGFRPNLGGESVASILTHLVIYPRKLTDAELFVVAQQWQ